MAKKNKQKRSAEKAETPSPLRADTGPRAAAGTPSRAETGPAPATQAPMPLFYKRLRPLHLKDHAGLGLRQPVDFSFAANVTAVPIVLGEFIAAAKDYPIVFGPGEVPIPMVMLGLRKAENMFVGKDGKWEPGAYIPAYIRRYPFLLVDAEKAQRQILFVDEDSDNLVKDGGLPLVTDGKPSELSQNVIKFCQSFAADQIGTRDFCKAAKDLGLMETRSITVTMAGGRKLVMQDLTVIDPRKFEALPDNVFLEWRKHKWLFGAYCHFQSGVNWQRLAMRAGGNFAPSPQAAATG